MISRRGRDSDPRDRQDGLSRTQQLERERQRKRREWQRRRVWASALFSLGAVVGIAHVVEHLGVFTIFSPGVDDLVAGFPMALALVIAGAIKLGPR